VQLSPIVRGMRRMNPKEPATASDDLRKLPLSLRKQKLERLLKLRPD